MSMHNFAFISLLTIFLLFIGVYSMAEQGTGYRAFPPTINHPSQAAIVQKEQFEKLEKQKLEEAPSACAGHTGTVVWYADKDGCIIQIQFASKPDVFVRSLYTFTPTMGMDQIDGEFAQDVEAYILNKELGCQSDRLIIFDGRESIGIMDYLTARGYTAKYSYRTKVPNHKMNRTGDLPPKAEEGMRVRSFPATIAPRFV